MITAKEWFIDIEVEGKYKGEKTLFIVDYYDIENIKLIIDADKDITQIYFGAGFQSTVKDYNVIQEISNIYTGIISLEVLLSSIVTIPSYILNNSRFHKILTIKIDEFVGIEFNTTLKIENKKGIYCYPFNIYNTWNSYNTEEEK